ncbi:MAG TPA: tRNA lysidine(34) synthetase TilS [Ktedonobacterales bacterium]
MDKPQKRLIGRIEGKVRRAVERYALWGPGATIVAAVSGGADSLCMLGALDALRLRGAPPAPGRVVVAHLDHALRGAAGETDAAFVADLAHTLGLDCVVGREDVGALARRQKRSLEDAARRARYAFLRRVAAEVGAERIVTGHTRDDQAETVLMHLLRGAGLSGLAGMTPLTGAIARPLLDLTRAETEAYCAARGWTPRHDTSNDDLAFLRNRVRHTLLPMLERENPSLRETLARNATLIAADAAYLDDLARDAWERAVASSDDRAITFDFKTLRALPSALRARLLREAYRRLAGEDGEELAARHVAAADDYVQHGVDSTVRQLPGGLRLMRGRSTLTVERTPGTAGGAAPSEVSGAIEPVVLPVPGEVTLPALGMRLRAELVDVAEARATMEAPGSTDVAYVDADTAGEALTVRTWRAGDRFQPLGMAHEKKLQDYFTDAHVPREERTRIPLVFGRDLLLWVAGHRPDHRARIIPATRRAIRLTITPEGSNAHSG